MGNTFFYRRFTHERMNPLGGPDYGLACAHAAENQEKKKSAYYIIVYTFVLNILRRYLMLVTYIRHKVS